MGRAVYLVGPERVELREEPDPRPGPGEAVLRVRAATTCGTDVKVFRRGGHPRMLRPPSRFGHEMAGVLESVGPDVASFAPGDRVVVANSAPCGDCARCRAGRENLCPDLEYLNGAYADRVLVPRAFLARNTHRIPDDVPDELAALAEPLACVLHGVEMSELEEGHDVCVLGAGPIGLLFVGVLAARGHRVTSCDPNPPRLAVARRLGGRPLEIERGGGRADEIRRAARDPAGFDLVVDASGVPAVWEDALRSVRPGGVVNLFGGCAPGTSIPLDTHSVHYSELTVKGVYHHRPPNFAAALEILRDPSFGAREILSGEAPLERVEDALRRMMAKEALKLVIRP